MSPEITDPTQELYKSVKYPYVRPEKIRYLLEKGADVNETRGYSTTILMTAVENVLNSKVINELLQAGADVNAVNQYGQNVLMRAAAHNTNPEIIRMLIDSGVDINSLDNHGNTVLMMASSKNNNPLVIMELIRAGADVNAVNKFGDTALIMSVETYFSFDEYRDEDCSLEIIKILVRSGADTEIKGQEGKTAISYAYEFESEEDKNPVLEFFRWRNRVLIYTDWKNITAEELRKLIYSGADVNETDLCERTPLMFAAANDEYVYNPKVIETLLAHGASVKHKDDHGRTALHYACQKIDDLDTFLMLIKAGADVNAQDRYGCTPLMLACSKEYFSVEAMYLLLIYGADVNIQDNDGWTALFWAAANKDILNAEEIIDALIFAGADIYIQDESEYGKTAMDAAVKYKIHKLLWELM